MKKILNLLHENLVNILGGHGIEINIRGCHPTQGPHPISFLNNGIFLQNDLLREKSRSCNQEKTFTNSRPSEGQEFASA